MIVIAFHNKKIFPIFPYFIALTSLLQAAPFAKMSIVSIISGAAAKASGGDFVQGALSAMVVWLYNETKEVAKEKEYKLRSQGFRVLAIQEIPNNPNSWIVIPEEKALEWRTKGNPREKANISEKVAIGFEFIATYTKNTPYYFISPIAEVAAKMCILDKYLLLKEAGEQLPVPDLIMDTVPEVIPMPTEKQKFWRNTFLDITYDEIKDWDY